MHIVPQMALGVILENWSLVKQLTEIDQTERLLQRYQAHWLVQFEQVIDLVPLEQACADFHCGGGRGRPVTHCVPRLVRALLIKYLYNLSYRETEEKIDRDRLVKWFVGYGPWAEPPDHTTLWRFELWVCTQRPRLFFDEILRQIDALYPDDRERLQLVDTFAMLARGARCSLISLIRDVCRKLLAALEKADLEKHAFVSSASETKALFGEKGDKPSRALNKQERAERLQQVVTAALRLHRLAGGVLAIPPYLTPAAQAPIQEWLDHLDKIITDETTVTQPDPDQPDTWLIKERPHGHKGEYRIGCVNDVFATFRHHGADKGDGARLGYNVSLLTSRYFIRAIQADTGARPDGEGLPDLLRSQFEQQHFFPAKVGGDQAYGTGKVRAAVNLVSQGHTQVVALVPNYEKRTDRFVPSDFIPLEEGLGLTCPNDVTTTTWYLKPNAEGVEYAFSAKMCQGCPFWVTPAQLDQDPDLPHCRKPDAKPNSRRKVFISAFRPFILAALAYNKTDQFKIEIKQRPHIERIIYNLTNIHGARRAKSTGQPKTNFQAHMNATAFNIRQLLRRQGRSRGLAKFEPLPPPEPEAVAA